jgi:UDP-galactopyranose mutase
LFAAQPKVDPPAPGTDDEQRYFPEAAFQGVPADGYTKMVARMLDHKNITVLLYTDYREIWDLMHYRQMIFSGRIDEFFDFRFGRLPFRGARFEHETHGVEQFQPAAVVYYPGQDVPYSRIIEFKHLTGQQHPKTSIAYEYPQADEGEPYYPVSSPRAALLYNRYRALADRLPGVHFVGRLAQFKDYAVDEPSLSPWRPLTN